MRVLLIYCHPRPDSFSAALRERAVAALSAGGHTVEARDLYAERFDPALSSHERGAYFDASPRAPDVEDHVAALGRAQALLLIYPTWWFGMPALLKGWLDRIWLPEVAFRLGPPPKIMVPLLTNIQRIAVVTTYGMPWWMLWWVGWPDRRVIRHGLKPLCARGCRLQWLALTRMDVDDAARRRRFLDKVARQLGRWHGL